MSEYISGGDAIAQRSHRNGCSECQGRIRRGRPFRAITFRDDGGIYTYKLCGRCARWADIFERDTGEREWAQGDIEQYRSDAIRGTLALRRKRNAPAPQTGEEDGEG